MGFFSLSNYYIKKKNMSNKLEELFQIGSKNDYEFHYKIIEEKENIFSLDKENKIIKVTIGDPEHKDLQKLLNDIIVEIKGEI